jgi:hypothetical protein
MRPRGRAEGQPYGKLTLATAGAGKQEIGEIRARDQQDQSGGAA